MSLRAECENAVGAGTDVDRLNRLMDEVWRHDLDDQPESATYFGVPGGHDRWTDQSLAAHERRRSDASAPLDALKAIDPDRLDAESALNLELFRRVAEMRAEAARFPQHLLAVSQMGGPQQRVASTLAMMPTATAEQRAQVMSRLAGVADLVDQTVELLRAGIAGGVTQPAVVMAGVPGQVEAMLTAADRSPLLEPFAGALGPDAEAVIDKKVNPAFERMHRFLVDEYLPAARTDIACAALPDGDEWYRHLVARHTTTALSPDEIHDIGLSEVARIRAAMDEVMAETGFGGGFDEFCHHLRTDPRFYCSTADELLARYRDICKRIDPGLAGLFGTLPRLPYGVKAVPSYSERSQTTAYYQPGSPDTGRPGWYFANTYDLASRPIWEMEALSLHEAVPGHHLQIALAQELEDVPEFRRRWGAYTAYVEGWGLYAESLGTDLGLYQDPHSRFGQLTYEMWRAVRLVVDTGMHSRGWTRDRAIDYFQRNSSKPVHDITVEVDRYIAWPGQALAYKIGERAIRALRAHAETQLGARFDVRSFHDSVLLSGPMPLDVLDRRVRDWVADELLAGADR